MCDIESLLSNLKVHDFNHRWDILCSLRLELKLLSSGLCKNPNELLEKCKEFIADISEFIATIEVSLDDPINVAVTKSASATTEEEFFTATAHVVHMLYEYGKSLDP